MDPCCSFCFKGYEECHFLICQPEREGYLRQAYMCDECVAVATGIIVRAFSEKKDAKNLAKFRKNTREAIKTPKKK